VLSDRSEQQSLLFSASRSLRRSGQHPNCTFYLPHIVNFTPRLSQDCTLSCSLAIESCTHKQSLVSMINPFERSVHASRSTPPSSLHLAHPCWENFREISRSEKGAAIVLWCNRGGARVEGRGARDKRPRTRVEGRGKKHSLSSPHWTPDTQHSGLPLDTRHSVLGNLKPFICVIASMPSSLAFKSQRARFD
jgi:hypothetical protein